MIFLLERGTESLHLLSFLLVEGAGESRAFVTVDVLALQVVLCTLDGSVGVFQCEHGVRVHEVGQILIGFRPRRPVFAHLGQFVNVALTEACAQELPQRRRVLEVCG